MARARIEMRLEEHEHATVRARGRERRGYLGRMVRVVVEDFDAARGSSMLEPAPGAGELRQYRRDHVARDTGKLECGNGAGSVLAVVGTCERQRPVVRRQLV